MKHILLGRSGGSRAANYLPGQLQGRLELMRRIQAFIRIRWIMIGMLLVIGEVRSFVSPSHRPEAWPIVLLATLAVLVNILVWFLTRSGEHSLSYYRQTSLGHIFTDIFFFSVAVYFTGGPISPAASLYILPVIIAATKLEGTVTYLVAVCSAAAYAITLALFARSQGLVFESAWAMEVLFYGAVFILITYIVYVYFGFNRQRSAAQAQGEMVSLVSHQLRTPATAVKGLLSLLMDESAECLTADAKDLLARAQSENERQLDIVNNLLQVARLEVESIKPDFKTVDMRKLVKAALKELDTQVKPGQKLTSSLPDHPVEAEADPDQIRMILDNLISNAINYSGPDSKIKVALAAKGSRVDILVRDSGRGIKAADQPKLFQRFSTLSQSSGGIGLGLYVVNKLTELHHGNVELTSSPGAGTTIKIQLPRHQS